MLSREQSVSFVPKVELIYKSSRQVRRELKTMFPSYVFVDTEIDGRSFVTLVTRIVRDSKFIIQLLGKDNPEHMSVNKEEKNFLLGICDKGYIVGESLGLIEGDMIFVTSGPYKGKKVL